MRDGQTHGPKHVAEDADPGTGKGFGLGTTTTSIIFLAAILAVVVLMTIQQKRHPVLTEEFEQPQHPNDRVPS